MGIFDFFRKKRLSKDEPLDSSDGLYRNEEERHEGLLTLSRKLSSGNEDVVLEVKESLLSPLAYCEKWQDRLDDRGISAPFEELSWIAMVDALIEERMAEEVDWKSESTTILYTTRKLIARKQLLPQDMDWSEFDFIEELPTAEALELMKNKLKHFDIALACLDINSDSYVLITVPFEELVGIKRLASKAGYQIADHFASS
ncbi:DUF6630 family protein [Paenibacillus luteus]|uniref:DUF6630 family protein n=1 Tax=Paenibacillus luteus TaxID=2545753 RepID=UPI0011420EC8|nr:DUF6630 family protein [Paenibacillus luteus]